MAVATETSPESDPKEASVELEPVATALKEVLILLQLHFIKYTREILCVIEISSLNDIDSDLVSIIISLSNVRIMDVIYNIL